MLLWMLSSRHQARVCFQQYDAAIEIDVEVKNIRPRLSRVKAMQLSESERE
jgi:hypothetical protein